ncbi:unnamed protein product [Clonostachys rosea]|uniref:Xylanolytic transcriptional activator regulatory domain-containing protein n=1 Tax=Bionectria ochroleuca TaxID=29856 RepID=A0ABY6U9P8_BIOOC|nr:unnamed protein product [Clonostachys rosea]
MTSIFFFWIVGFRSRNSTRHHVSQHHSGISSRTHRDLKLYFLNNPKTIRRIVTVMENEGSVQSPQSNSIRYRKKTLNAYIDGLLDRIKSLESRLQTSRHPNAPGPGSSHDGDEQISGSSTNNDQTSRVDPNKSHEYDDLTNSLVASEPQIKVKRYGQPSKLDPDTVLFVPLTLRAAYLGHSSTLSFSRNVRNLLQRSTPVADPGSVSVEREDISYNTTLPAIKLDLTSIPLPRLQYAEYLTSTVVVQLGSLYCLFESDTFVKKLRQFYEARSKGTTQQPSLWHIQMLLVLAFGKSLLSREHSDSGPSGMTYFKLAMGAFPDVRQLCENPLLSIEILCLASLFLHAADMLQEAYILIGQALRISVTQGLNQAFPEPLRPPNVQYMRRLWWSVYCIDRKSAALLGSPSVMRDEDITIPVPSIQEGHESQNVVSIHIALSSHLGKILDVIYGMRGHSRGKFVVEVQAILSRLAETSSVLNEHLDLDTARSNEPLSRDATTLHLLLHQCVILTVRPVLFSLLKPLLSPESASRPSAFSFESLLRMCVESSIRILQIMFTLQQQSMCDLFLPYDIDALFSASFALLLIDIIRPAKELLWDLPKVINLLDSFIERQVAPARTYKIDLLQLIELHKKIHGARERGHMTTSDSIELAGHGDNTFPHTIMTDTSPDPVWSRVRDGENSLIPMHPDTINSVIEDLNFEGVELLDATMPDDSWMWNFNDLSPPP